MRALVVVRVIRVLLEAPVVRLLPADVQLTSANMRVRPEYTPDANHANHHLTIITYRIGYSGIHVSYFTDPPRGG